MSNSRKRSRVHLHRDRGQPAPETHDSPLDACVQGYEATLTYGQEAFAKSLRMPGDRGGQLMRWIGSAEGMPDLDGLPRESEAGRKQEVWIDRYDALHLLPTLPTRSTRALSPASSSGWSDVPSDAEDTFFLSGDEGQEYEREKKRRRIEAGREQRVAAMKARMAAEIHEGNVNIKPTDDEWGDSDEEPPAAVKTLMRHTYKSLAESPNPQVLELRILTHHAGDARFSFLKGRYKAAWQAIKSGKELREVEAEGAVSSGVKTEAEKGGLGGLMGDYGDSDSESDSSKEEEAGFVPPLPAAPPSPETEDLQLGDNRTGILPDEEELPLAVPPLPTEPYPETPDDTSREEEEEKARAIRREKARAWMAARKQATTKTMEGGV